MYYECPHCMSKKPPKIIVYYPPKLSQCKDCLYEADEEEFIQHKPAIWR